MRGSVLALALLLAPIAATAVEPGMRAHLVVFDADPLEDPRAIIGGKVVIKDGVVHPRAASTAKSAPEGVADPPGERWAPYVEYLANEGVLVTAGDRMALIDGLFGDGLPSYPVVEPAVRDSLERAQGRFAEIHAILVTHVHRDHFDARAIARHLEANPEARLVAPSQAVDTLRAEIEHSAAILDRVDAVRLDPGETALLRVGGFEIRAIGLVHPPSRNEPVELVGYRVETNGYAIGHIGDASLTPDELEPFIGVDLLLAPWWVLTGAEGARRLAAVGADRVAAFHLGLETAASEVEERLSEGVDITVLRSSGTRMGGGP
ncbi:MAG: MBL fold metallo-hydrolase [Gemmatimonadota bacterium]|nr:MBL fold metallo-hydrolase [Gemmatimonadota bacterium]